MRIVPTYPWRTILGEAPPHEHIWGSDWHGGSINDCQITGCHATLTDQNINDLWYGYHQLYSALESVFLHHGLEEGCRLCDERIGNALGVAADNDQGSPTESVTT